MFPVIAKQPMKGLKWGYLSIQESTRLNLGFLQYGNFNSKKNLQRLIVLELSYVLLNIVGFMLFIYQFKGSLRTYKNILNDYLCFNWLQDLSVKYLSILRNSSIYVSISELFVQKLQQLNVRKNVSSEVSGKFRPSSLTGYSLDSL